MRVALVHDYLTQYGGAERVLEHLHGMFPDATVRTSFYNPDRLPSHFRDWTIETPLLCRLPLARQSHRLWLPLYPAIFGHIGRSIRDVDAVIADSSAWAHHARPGADVPLICYCHSPARFLYGDAHYLGASRLPGPIQRTVGLGFGSLRALDRRAASRVTRYIANSETVAARIRETYGREARVVHPPVDTGRFRPRQPVAAEDWMLVVSRLVPHKWVDLAVRACTVTGTPLKVIGDGRARRNLERTAGPHVEFLGGLPDAEVVWHMQRCLALVLPGVEDFGMTAVEAQAAGRPVLAAGAGGARETVRHGETGLLWTPQDRHALADAIRECMQMTWDSARIIAHAGQFSASRFQDAMNREVEIAVNR